jgi:ABC-type transporter Mla subunit MlaD
MSMRTHNFRIGLFGLTGAGLFIGALFAMGLKSYFGARDVYETYVPGKVDNLSVGALVKLRGVTIGKVSSIDFIGTEYPQYKEQSVVICFKVPKDFEWNTETNVQQMLDREVALGLRARVQGQGFLGANIVSLEYVDPKLYPVEEVPWTPKHYYIPSAPNQFNRVLASLEKSLWQVQNLDVSNALARAEKLIDAAGQLVANINQVNFNQLGTNANSLVVEFRQTNRGLQQTLARAQDAIKDADGAIHGADLPDISRDTVTLEENISRATADLRRLLNGVDTVELNNSLANVRSATDELTVLLHTLRQQPSAVVFSKPPKPVTEMEDPPRK